MEKRQYYIVFAPWGENGCYFSAILDAETGDISHFYQKRDSSRAKERAREIAARESLEIIEILDPENPEQNETFQKIISKCNPESRDIYRAHGLCHY